MTRIYLILCLPLIGCFLVRSIPIRGNFPHTILLCKFYENDFEPKRREDFLDWITSSQSEGSISEFFRQLSNGVFTMDNTNVFDWFFIPYSKTTVQALATKDPNLNDQKDTAQKLFTKTKELCHETARSLGFSLYPNIITVINDGSFALFCKENGVLLSPAYFMSSALAHEMVHDMHIGHSFSTRDVQVFDYAKQGEYDDKLDLMSTAHAFMYPAKFGMNGPGLNGPHLDYLGWLPASRIYFFGAQGERSRIFRLAPLSIPYRNSRGLLLVHVPYDRDNPQKTFTVEFRTKTAHDKGIPRNAVIIHQIREIDGYLYSYLLPYNRDRYSWHEGNQFVQILDQDQQLLIRIRVESISDSGADVLVESGFSPQACRTGEVFRDAAPFDEACVSSQEKGHIFAESRGESRNGDCSSGEILRELTPEDTRCITERGKTMAEAQNQRWIRRKNFFNLTTFGLNACKSEFVWRQIDENDFVCVTPERKREIERQNEEHEINKSNISCRIGYVYRQAFRGDLICVSPTDRLNARFDSQNANSKLLYHKFFNGVDTVD